MLYAVDSALFESFLRFAAKCDRQFHARNPKEATREYMTLNYHIYG